jgi:hypothetical protein
MENEILSFVYPRLEGLFAWLVGGGLTAFAGGFFWMYRAVVDLIMLFTFFFWWGHCYQHFCTFFGIFIQTHSQPIFRWFVIFSSYPADR